MRKQPLIAGAAALALAASPVAADFAITAVRTDLGAPNAITNNGNGTIPGYYSLIEFYAKSLGASGMVNQGTKLASVSLTMTDTGAGNLVIGGYNQASGIPAGATPADLLGQHEISAVGGSYVFRQTLTTTTGAPQYVSFVNLLGDPSVASDNNPNHVVAPAIGFSPANTYSNYGYAIKTFSVDYASSIGGVDATTANGGLGALFAVAVAPIADSVRVQGEMGGTLNTGIQTNFNMLSTVLPGDANLDGKVDINDAHILQANWNLQSGATWSQGDFTMDGAVNLSDAMTLIQNYNLGTATPGIAMLTPAPEPGSIAILSLGATLLLRRGRRTR